MKTDSHPLLAPVTRDQFFQNYWEAQPLHVTRQSSGHFASLLTTADIETAVSSRDLYFPTVQLTQKGRNFDASDYADAQQRILALRLMQLHGQGATLVLSQAQQLFPSLGRLCREVTQLMKMRCQANVYWSPAGNQGFDAHYDTHDVFILQVSGEKTFNFYEQGVDLPFNEDRFDKSAIESAQPSDAICLQAGDTLYIPRGLVHDAVAEDTGSLHITLGVFPDVARDLLQGLVQVAAEGDRRFRQSSLFLNDDLEDVLAQMKTLAAELADPKRLREVLRRQQENLALEMPQDAIGALDIIRLSESLQPETMLRLKPDAVISQQRDGETLYLHCFGSSLEFNEPMTTAMLQILTGQPFCADSLTMLSDEQRLALCKQLLRNNLLVTTKASA
jgi:ribosomal protein L16 Arg81 hydroxylase